MKTSLVSSGLAASSLLLIAGCSSTISGDSVANQIDSQIKQAFPEASSQVTCPPDITPQAGATFDCTAVLNGQTLPIVVTQEDDQGTVSFEASSAILSVAQVEEQIAAQYTEKDPGTWSMTCQPPTASGGVYVAPPGTSFDCTLSGTNASGEQASGTVRVTVEDAQGGVQWEVIATN